MLTTDDSLLVIAERIIDFHPYVIYGDLAHHIVTNLQIIDSSKGMPPCPG
jgi:hypothetical protein